MVQAGDLVRVRAFYGETLGLTERFADDKAVGCDVGPGLGLLLRLADVDPGPVHPIWLSVPDARAEAEALAP